MFFPRSLFNLPSLIGSHQSRRSCALWGLGPLPLNMWFCGSGHRHLLTHSVEIRHRLQLRISETIVTNKKLVAEWKLCILSQRSCWNITVPDKFLCRILAALEGGAPSFHADNISFHTRTHSHFCNPGTVMVIYIQYKGGTLFSTGQNHLMILIFYVLLTTVSEKIGPK